MDAADGFKLDQKLSNQAEGPGVLLTADGGRYEGNCGLCSWNRRG